MTESIYKRNKYVTRLNNLDEIAGEVNQLLNSGRINDALDLIDFVATKVPEVNTKFLSFAFDIYQKLAEKNSRYDLYVSRTYDFSPLKGKKVLDIGSGHMPFPFATHLADFAIEDHDYGRAGVPFKHIEGKPVFSCSVESMPFEDKFFDFAYCSHVLEHVDCPITACKELMRVAKSGYIETPNRAKDLFLNTAKISNHHWMVEYFNDTLIFSEYNEEQIDGLESNILMSMHCSPETEREKAFAALLYLKSDHVNTILQWENGFNVEVRRIGKESEKFTFNNSSKNLTKPNSLSFSTAS